MDRKNERGDRWKSGKRRMEKWKDGKKGWE
jgi:hypothetical protein